MSEIEDLGEKFLKALEMDMMNAEELAERFLKANANVDYMAVILADILRNCMRSAADGDQSQVHQAAENFSILCKLISYSEGVSSYDLVEKAIQRISVPPSGREIPDATVYASKMGVRVLVESSCEDRAASGRASRRMGEFRDAIKLLEQARDRARRGL